MLLVGIWSGGSGFEFVEMENFFAWVHAISYVLGYI